MIPDLPVDLGDHGMTDDDLAVLWNQMIMEMLDARYAGRTHGNRRTYDAGCGGPLCSKATREYGRRRAKSSTPSEKYKFIDPILDFWRPIAESKIHEAQRAVLAKLTLMGY